MTGRRRVAGGPGRTATAPTARKGLRFLMRGALGWLGVLCLIGCAAPHATGRRAAQLPDLTAERVLRETDRPALFLGAEPDAPVIGYSSGDLVVRVLGDRDPGSGRVPVQALGPLEIQAHVPGQLLTVRVQRRGRLRGTPVYLGPNDRVRVVGPDVEPGRVRVDAAARLRGLVDVHFVGSFPARGLAAHKAGQDTLPPDEGAPYVLPQDHPLELWDAPEGALVARLPPLPVSRDVTVLRSDGPWFAVRLGLGPYLLGYTRAPLVPRKAGLAEPSQAQRAAVAQAPRVPDRLSNEAGVLKRVAAGTQISFNDAPLAVLRAEGWARVLAEYPNGEVDVLVAVDNRVAVRGLVPKSALREVPPDASDGAADSPVATAPDAKAR